MQQSYSFTTRTKRGILAAFVIVFLMRIAMLFQIPFTDNSESRYAEMARWMTVSHDWITPQITPGNPFWAKPPLSMWLAAGGIEIFGANEFGARILIFLTAVAVVALLYQWVKKIRGADFALASSFILFTSVLFIVTSGTVMTDLAMMASTTFCMIAFWNAMHGPSRTRLWGYLFFVGIGLGLLAKGPVSTVLTMLPIGIWTLWTRQIPAVWKRVPWITGGLLALAIAAPWYAAAEIKTPGFLNYFILGEHFGRFLIKGWKGDMYGHAHPAARGMIWFFAMMALMPWSISLFVSIPGCFRSKSKVREAFSTDRDRWLPYLLCWSLAPWVFFTFSRNIISTYPITGMPAAAILILEAWRLSFRPDRIKVLLRSGTAFAIILMAGIWVIYQKFPNLAPKDSEKRMIGFIQSHPEYQNYTLYYRRPTAYSAVFYHGKQIEFISDADLPPLTANQTQDLVVIRSKDREKIRKLVGQRFDEVTTIGNETLLAEKPEHLPANASTH
ncbi:glycosyltransferase family 39 protein [Luteolibacter pohnpeiensis]|uniref:Glycosyltransferase family 39 protein n=1 Tax=Luteolibacter pohnpeiensis TaxID=454153 RepID=A0A934S741_9BACT|nr:glycosyltransferase family 39 protein [Luteolibacter pohnpeiensis]MBK1883063.1 glycosyltransferase family 39 protein [Luteolibacter pohnpeiensis]